jgi:hypothetical protein
MELIAVIILGGLLSALAIGNGLISSWDDREREKNLGKP